MTRERSTPTEVPGFHCDPCTKGWHRLCWGSKSCTCFCHRQAERLAAELTAIAKLNARVDRKS